MREPSNNQQSATVTIRQASSSDAHRLARLRYAFRSSLDQVNENQVNENEESFVERCTPWMTERLQDSSIWKCWLAERDSLVVGNLWAHLIEKIPNPTLEPEHHAYITNLYVCEDCRGQGIGAMLLSAALLWVQTNDVHAVILWPTERSRSLYQRHGFSAPEDLLELIEINVART